MNYPKINTLWKRSPDTNKVLEGEHSRDEFKNIKAWEVTEKIDGMNIRIYFKRDPDSLGAFNGVLYYGRTDNAQIPDELKAMLERTFTYEMFCEVFEDDVDVVWMFGEGYGPKIQNGGNYRPDQSVILFDVVVEGMWLERSSVLDIAEKFGVEAVPMLVSKMPENLLDDTTMTEEEIVTFVKSNPYSSIITMNNKKMEGIVARPSPLMLFRDGTPIMFKLKARDYRE